MPEVAINGRDDAALPPKKSKVQVMHSFASDKPGVELPTSPYTSKDKSGLVTLPKLTLVWLSIKDQCVIHPMSQ